MWRRCHWYRLQKLISLLCYIYFIARHLSVNQTLSFLGQELFLSLAYCILGKRKDIMFESTYSLWWFTTSTFSLMLPCFILILSQLLQLRKLICLVSHGCFPKTRISSCTTACGSSQESSQQLKCISQLIHTNGHHMSSIYHYNTYMYRRDRG